MNNILDTVVRCHVKNDDRLKTLERLILSWKDKQLNELGNLYLLDDHSPMNKEVEELAKKHEVIYKVAEGYGDTKNGLVESLKLSPDRPVLCCVDDMVFGKGIKERILSIFEQDLPVVQNWGMFGLFACYQDHTRNTLKENNIDSWYIPNEIIYALVCHIFSPNLSSILIKEWEGIKDKTLPDPCCCDDIWVARICTRENIDNFNTFKDYGFHTGMMNRTFGDLEKDPGSEYQTPCFVGE